MNLAAINEATSGKTRTTGVSAFMELELTKVFPNPNQPRKNFQNIEELAQSIQAQGLIQPIAVVKKEDGYMVVSGERRYRACQYLELKSIKAHVLQADDVKVEELSLIENIQREDLSDFEKAKFIGQLWASGKYEQKQDLAAAIGKSASYISKAFSSLKLDSSILNEIEENKNNIPLSVLEEISRVKDKDTQREVYEKYIAGEITRDDIKSFKFPAKEKKLNTKSEVLSTVDWIRKLVKEKATLKGNCIECEPDATGCVKFHEFENNYERIIYDLALEIEELNKKEIYIISYQNKKTSHGGGGHRVRAYNEDEALELGKEHYSEYAKDKNYIFEVRSLSSCSNTANLSDYISYGFGTQNTFGTFISLTKGDFIGSIKLESNTEIVTTSNDFNYQVILKKIDTPKEELKEIKLIEVLSDSVYIEYTDFDSIELSFSKAKEMIKKSSQKSIPYVLSSSNDKSCDFINKMPNRTQKNGSLVLKNAK